MHNILYILLKIHYNPFIGIGGYKMLNNEINVFRAKKKWTQQQLADQIGVSRQTIAAMEKNKYNPSLILAFKVANALDIPITDVFNYKEDNK